MHLGARLFRRVMCDLPGMATCQGLVLWLLSIFPCVVSIFDTYDFYLKGGVKIRLQTVPSPETALRDTGHKKVLIIKWETD